MHPELPSFPLNSMLSEICMPNPGGLSCSCLSSTREEPQHLQNHAVEEKKACEQPRAY